MARYIIEPSEEDFLLYDANRAQDLPIVKSVFRKLIGPYTLLTEEEENAISNELAEVKNYMRKFVKIIFPQRYCINMDKVYRPNSQCYQNQNLDI